jgi:hypothetical protein
MPSEIPWFDLLDVAMAADRTGPLRTTDISLERRKYMILVSRDEVTFTK